MKQKKKFVSPRVIQDVQVQLEKDFLQGGSVRFDMTVSSMGQGVGTYMFSDSKEEEPTYFVDWD